MKRFSRILAAVVSLSLVICGVSCSSGDDDDSSKPRPALSYEYIANNRAFIGGSVIYNPDGTNNQLEPGTIIGVRLGVLSPKLELTNQISGVDYDSGTPVVVDVNDNASFSVSGGSVTSAYKTVYEDNPLKAQYGFLKINSVSPDNISFSFTKFSADGKNFNVSSKSIKKGDYCDLNGDGLSDLKYDIPDIKRTGYENAMWLTFLCSEENEKTTMYYTFTAKEKSNGYRAVSENPAANSIPNEGFYGVNSDGRFIYIKYQNGDKNSSLTVTEEYVFGDFIVGINSKNVFNSELEVNAETASESDEIEAPQVSLATDCYTVIHGDPGTSNALDFEYYDYKYTYELSQFPDQKNGPKDLLDKLCANTAIKEKIVALNESDELPSAAADVITLLNKVLVNSEAVKEIAYQNNRKTDYDAIVADPTFTEAGNRYARRLIDSIFTQSPKADIKAPELANIYPFLFATIGNPSAEDSSDASRSIYYDDQARTVNDTYEEYDAKLKKINEKWNEFSCIEISSIKYKGEGDKDKKVTPKSVGFRLAAGMKGNISVTSSRAEVKLGAAIYVNLDIDPTQIGVNQVVQTLMSGIKLGIPDAEFPIGPVPCVFGVSVAVGLNVDFSNSPRLCFVGLYGGEATVGANYGINWKWGVIPYPYFNTFANGEKICETEFYYRPLDNKGDLTVTWGPWVKVTPSFGIGWSSISVRGSVPITTTAKITNKMNGSDFSLEKAALEFKAEFQPYFEATVLKIITIKATFTTIELKKGTLQIYPLPMKWL